MNRLPQFNTSSNSKEQTLFSSAKGLESRGGRSCEDVLPWQEGHRGFSQVTGDCLRRARFSPGRRFPTYQLDTFKSSFRLLVAYYRATKSSAKSDSLRIRGRSAEFRRSNRQPLLGFFKVWVAWRIFVPKRQRNRTIKAHGMITEVKVGNL